MQQRTEGGDGVGGCLHDDDISDIKDNGARWRALSAGASSCAV